MWYPNHYSDLNKEQFNILNKSKGEEIALKIDVMSFVQAGKKHQFCLRIPPKKEGGKMIYKKVYVNIIHEEMIREHPGGRGLFIYTTVKKIEKPEKISFKDKYKTFENFMNEYCGYEKRDSKMNRYGNWYNPQAKWDWHQLGGRWTGCFPLKTKNALALVGEHSKFSEPPKAGYYDKAKKSDIDFETRYNDKNAQALVDWEKIQELINKNDTTHAYWDYGYNGETKEQFIKNRSVFSTFAVLKDGKWFSRGEMGWWGAVADEKDQNIWLDEYKKMIDELPNDVMLSVYDCHI